MKHSGAFEAIAKVLSVPKSIWRFVMIRKTILLSLLFLVSILAFGCTNPHTPAGNEGFVFEDPRVFGKGGFRGVIKGPANYGVSLWRNRVLNIDMRPETYDENLKILARDDLNVTFRFHAVLSIKQDSVKDVVQKYGAEKWYARFIREPFRTYIRNSVQQYTSREIKANRDVIANNVRESLLQHIQATPFQLVSLVVGNIDYPDVVAQAVEKKLAAQQLLEEKAVQKEIAQKDAEIKIEEAKGIAQAQKIINATLTANYLQHEAIMAQQTMANSPNHTTVYIPVGANGMPIVYTPK